MAFNTRLNNTSRAAYDAEKERLKRLTKFQEQEAAFLTTEGKGISAKAEIQFGDETDLENLTEEERRRRSTGRVARDVGLFL